MGRPWKNNRDVIFRGSLVALQQCTDREVLIEGRAGTSKTTGICHKLLERCKRFPGSRHLIVRQTRESLTESVLPTLERMIGITDPEVVRVHRTHRHSYLIAGSEIVIGGLDKPEKLFSTEWDTVYMAESTESRLESWELFGRAMRHNACDYHQRIADCNPGPPAHWLNRRATSASDELRHAGKSREAYNELQAYNFNAPLEDGRPMRRLISVHQDNPAYWDFDTWDWTPQGRLFIEELKSMTGYRRARMLDGRWVAAEGSVYPEFDESRHVVRPFVVPKDWPWFIGIDPGYDHPCAILWFTVSPNETIYIADELYRGGMSVQQHARDITARNAGRDIRRIFGDPQHCWSRTAQSPKPIAQQFRECGLRMAPWPRSVDVEAMVNEVRRLLTLNRLKVFRTCTATIDEFQAWRYKRTVKGEIPNGDDQFEDANNHAMDCVKGIVAARIAHAPGQIRQAG